MMEILTADTFDQQLVEALSVDGRAPFSRLADVLGVSDQLVARRYRRLRRAGALRVVGLPNGPRLGFTRWLLRVHTTPDASRGIADALARRPDTSWVHQCSGGAEVCCFAETESDRDRDALLLERLPRVARVLDFTAHLVLHDFTDEAVRPSPRRRLDKAQVSALTRAMERDWADQDAIPPAPALDGTDRRLLTALGEDGRASYATLAAATGWSESTAKRRLARLRRARLLYFDVDWDPRLLGPSLAVRLWLVVEPARLAATGEALAALPDVAYVAATTGPVNLVGSVICADAALLYRFLTTEVASLPGVRGVETAPIVRTAKRERMLPAAA